MERKMILKYVLICAVLITLSFGCVKKENKVEQIGPYQYIISCPYNGRQSYTKAYEVCPTGYRVDREYADFITSEPSRIFITCASH